MNKICLICQKQFSKGYFVSLNNWNKAKFCSPVCNGMSRKGICRSIHTRQKIKIKMMNHFTSIQTRQKISFANKGEKCYKWKGGISTESALIRSSPEIREWKKQVLMRDNYTCQITGKKGGRLIVHHLYNFAHYPNLRFNLSNGITLSYEKHQELHKKYGLQIKPIHFLSLLANS